MGWMKWALSIDRTAIPKVSSQKHADPNRPLTPSARCALIPTQQHIKNLIQRPDLVDTFKTGAVLPLVTGCYQVRFDY